MQEQRYVEIKNITNASSISLGWGDMGGDH